VKVWAAKEIKGRISAQNAVKIRAVIKTSFNARQIVEDYLGSNPDKTDNETADRVRARSWVMVHVRTDPKPLEKAINRVLAEGWATGNKAARSMIKTAVNKASVSSIALDPTADVWAGWTPGDEAVALLVDPPSGLKTLIDNSQSTARSALSTKYDQVGTALATGFRSGESLAKMTERVAGVIDDPSQALTIATTEMSRATNQSAMNSYQNAGLGSVQWFGIDPCPICAENDGEIVALGDDFPSGDSEPPAHPNCLCTILPVIDEMAYRDVTDQIDQAANDAFNFAQAREGVLTDLVMGLADATNATPNGMDYRLKQVGSISRKIADEIKTGAARSPESAAHKMADLNRYTLVWDNKNYVQGVKDSLDSLIQKGYETRVKNYWEREDYRGINVAVKDRSGKEFEVQFHTTESVTVKEELHKLYEEYRVEKNDAKRWNLWNKMTKLAGKIPDPKDYQDLLKIGDLKQVRFTDSMGNVRGTTSSFSKWYNVRDTAPKKVAEQVFKPIEPMPVVNEPIKPMDVMFSDKRNAEIKAQIEDIKGKWVISEKDLLKEVKNSNSAMYATVKKYYEDFHKDLPFKDRKIAAEADLTRLIYYIENNNSYEDFKSILAPDSIINPARISEFKQAEIVAKEKITEALKNGNVTIAIKKDDLFKVFEDGRFKNQFEIQKSNGYYDPEMRSISEKTVQEVPVNIDPAERPIYGFISTGEEIKTTVPDESAMSGLARIWDNKLSLNSEAVSQYGDIRLVLKQDVKDRTTATIGDSLYSGVIADKVTAETPDLLNMGFYYKGISVNGIYPSMSYLEAQITGGVKVGDIAAIYAPQKDIPNLVAKLKELNLNIPIVPRKWGIDW